MSQAVQTNGTKPLSKTWDLSLNELQRTPQEAIRDGLKIVVSPGSVHSELMCPVCSDTLKNTMTTQECLHHFRADCITTALRSGDKERPTCQKRLVSERSLRPQTLMHSSADFLQVAMSTELINRVSPGPTSTVISQHSVIALRKDEDTGHGQMTDDSEALKGRLETVGAADNGDSCHRSNASTHSHLEAGPRNKRTKTSDDSGPQLDNNNATVAVDSVMDGASETELLFRPRPTLLEKDDNAQTRSMKTPGNATVDHVSEHLAVRMALELQSK